MNAKIKSSKKYRLAVWLFSPFIYMWAMLVLAKYLKAIAVAIDEEELWI